MTANKKDQPVRQELDRQLAGIRERMEMLDLIDERLKEMRALAQRAADPLLSDEERVILSRQLRKLEEEVRLLARTLEVLRLEPGEVVSARGA